MRGHPQRLCPRGTDAAGAGRVSGEGLALGALERFCAGHLPAVPCHRRGCTAPGRLLPQNELPAALPCRSAGSRRGHSRAGGRAVLQQRHLHRGLLLWALPGTGDPSSELKWACSGEHFSRDSRRDVCSPGSTGMGTAPQDSPAPGAAGCVAGLGTVLLFAQAPVAWGRSGAPGTCEPGEVVFGEGVPAPLPAESLITFCSIYSPLASWCFPSASRTWFPFERKRVF